jgi:hypothetical protein
MGTSGYEEEAPSGYREEAPSGYGEKRRGLWREREAVE